MGGSVKSQDSTMRRCLQQLTSRSGNKSAGAATPLFFNLCSSVFIRGHLLQRPTGNSLPDPDTSRPVQRHPSFLICVHLCSSVAIFFFSGRWQLTSRSGHKSAGAATLLFFNLCSSVFIRGHLLQRPAGNSLPDPDTSRPVQRHPSFLICVHLCSSVAIFFSPAGNSLPDPDISRPVQQAFLVRDDELRRAAHAMSGPQPQLAGVRGHQK
jgi:hypothetical protein